jgi:hypothetical protein
MALVTGFTYLFGGGDEAVFQWSFFINIVCWIGASLLLMEIISGFLKRKLAFFFTLAYIGCIGSTVIAFHLLAENIFTFFLMLFVFFLQKYYREKRFFFLAVAIAVLILSMLVKPASQFIAIIMVLYFIKTLFLNYKKKAMLFVYIALLAVFVQVAGIKFQFGDCTISYIDAVTYYNYIGSKALCIKNGQEFDQYHNPRTNIFNFEPKVQNKIASDDLKFQLKTNRINLLNAYADDVFGNTVSGSAYLSECKNRLGKSYFNAFRNLLLKISEWQNIVFTIIGFLLSVFYLFKWNKAQKQEVLISIFILYIMLSSGISCGQGDRFHIVAFPFIIILAAKF